MLFQDGKNTQFAQLFWQNTSRSMDEELKSAVECMKYCLVRVVLSPIFNGGVNFSLRKLHEHLTKKYIYNIL